MVRFEADVRFHRQVWELTVPFPGAEVDAAGIEGLVKRFEDEYVRRYGSGSRMLGAPVELVTLRAIGTASGEVSDIAMTNRRGVRSGTVATPTGPAPGSDRARAPRMERGLAIRRPRVAAGSPARRPRPHR